MYTDTELENTCCSMGKVHSPSPSTDAAASLRLLSEFPPPKGYTFLEPIGSGTFAKVFRAMQHSTGEHVAIKVIDKQPLSSRGLALIMREIEALWELSHPNIMRMFDMIETEELLYLITELCDGDILRIIRYRGNASSGTRGTLRTCPSLPSVPSASFALPEDLTRHLFAQLIDAMSYAHEKNFCHRDIKLENLFVTTDLVLKVGDWGFASNFTPTSYLSDHCGSLPYAAPEICLRQSYCGAEVDVWSMGVCLYTMVAGSFPFEPKGVNCNELVRKIQQAEFFMPPWFSPELRHLINRFLEPVPSRRIKLEEVRQHPWMMVPTTASLSDLLAELLLLDGPTDFESQRASSPPASGFPAKDGGNGPKSSRPGSPSSPTTSPFTSAPSPIPSFSRSASSPPSTSRGSATSAGSGSSRHLNRTPTEQPVADSEFEQNGHNHHNNAGGSKMVTAVTKGLTFSKMMISHFQTFTYTQYNFVKSKARVWRTSLESCLTMPLEVEVFEHNNATISSPPLDDEESLVGAGERWTDRSDVETENEEVPSSPSSHHSPSATSSSSSLCSSSPRRISSCPGSRRVEEASSPTPAEVLGSA